mmetsp:Transcript_86166/g.196635  ORF Transcript_86166/g.196635 Transcript_86166/m.196635 type:complete len:257 (-) Transcript_86166:656-1426(-)
MISSVQTIHTIHPHHPGLHPLRRPPQRLPSLKKTGPRQNGPRQLGQPVHFVLFPLVFHVEILVQNAVLQRQFLIHPLDSALEGLGQLALGSLRLFCLQQIHKQERHAVSAQKVAEMAPGSGQVHVAKLEIHGGLRVGGGNLLRPEQRHGSPKLHIRHRITRVQAARGHIADYLLHLDLVGAVTSRVQPSLAKSRPSEKPRPPGHNRNVKIPPQRRAQRAGNPPVNHWQDPCTPFFGRVQQRPHVVVVPRVPVVLLG